MSDKTNHKESKNIRALFTVVCLCIVALGLIVYFSATHKTVKPNAVNENQTLKVSTTVRLTEPTTIGTTQAPEPTTEVQHAVTVKENPTAADDGEADQDEEHPTMPQSESNTPYKSFYKYPLSEAVLKGYSEELVYDDTMGDFRAHAAVDFSGSEGDAVVAINDGIVLDTYTDNLLGNVVVIDHGGQLVVKYCGLKSIAVKAGRRVDIGNKIGTLGKVPNEAKSDPHLHLEARLDGVPVNPLDVMGKTE